MRHQPFPTEIDLELRAHPRSTRSILSHEIVVAVSRAWQARAFGTLFPMIFDLISPLSREECVQRLRSKADPAWSGAVTGSVGETSFRVRKRIYHRNSFQYSLSGKLVDDNGI